MPKHTRPFAAASILVFAAGCGGLGGDAAKAPMTARAYPREMMPAPMAPAGTAAVAQPAPEPIGTEGFKDYGVNPFVDASKDKLSTFSIDVDTASYSFARRVLTRENR